MTADFDKASSDLPELPESLKRFGEGPLGDGFRRLFAELVKEFTVEQIAQIVSGSDATPREVAELKAELEAEGWTVLTSSTPEPNPLSFDIRELTAHIPTLESYLFPQARSAAEQPSQIILGDLGARKARAMADWKAVMEARGWTVVTLDGDQILAERPSELSEAEKLQAAARPIRGRHLSESSLLRPDAKTLDQRIKDLLGSRLASSLKSEENAQKIIDPDLLRTVEPLGADEDAAAALRENREAEDTVIVPSELWHAVRGVLGYPGLDDALISLAEESNLPPYWYSDEVKWIRGEIDTLKVGESGIEPLPAHPGDLKLSDSVKRLFKRAEGLFLTDPQKHSKSDAELRAEGNRVHELIEKAYREKGFSATVADILLGKLDSKETPKAETEKPETSKIPESTSSFGSKFGGPLQGILVDYLRLVTPTEDSKSDEPRTGKDLSGDFSVQDLIADYDESKLPGAAGYITLEGNRFPGLYAQLVELFTAEGFNDRDRLVGLLALLDGYEASDDYSTGDAYHISRIRQLLKRR